ncbi:MAG: 3-dehydroquinate synthase [Candidatus Brocadiae bacterium]|nr:3-dehydroquinate synthase [Candidatus Brocadiia bacterium]
MCLNELAIKSKIKDYTVFFEKDGEFLNSLANLENSIFVVDENVWNLYKSGCLKPLPIKKVIIQTVCEEIKNISTVCKLYEQIMAHSPRKNLNLVSIGGGIIQDLTGFVASSLYRGINWIFLPTTLLAQVDSCIGAKTSLNFNQFKNLLGTFYPPSKIHIYPEFLNTLTKVDYYSGVGEMAKLHIIKGKEDTKIFINSLPKIAEIDGLTVLERTQNCLKIKKSYIEDDEFDTGKRNMLNYGHCFGHAIESATDFAISHGQAVVVGMIIANKAAKKQGFLSEENEHFIRQNVLLPSLKTNLSKINIDVEKTILAMDKDKKNLGAGLTLVMINDDYDMVKITDLRKDDARILIEGFKRNITRN